MTTLLLIDGNALIHRAYHALPDFRTSKGEPTNAVYGFATMLQKAVVDFKPTHIAVCFDTAAPTFRDELFIEYRTQRPETDDLLKDQFPRVKELVTASGLAQLEKDGLEADDLIAIIATHVKNKVDRTIIMTGDKDMLQLVDKTTFVAPPQLGFFQNKLYDEKSVTEKFGINPNKIADWKALAGDPSDNYKGVPGIGPKGAAALVRQFGSVENLYENLEKVESVKTRELLVKHKKDALMGKKLATLVTENHVNVTLEKLVFEGFSENLLEFFDKMEFQSLNKRFFPAEKQKTTPKQEKVDEKKEQMGLF